MTQKFPEVGDIFEQRYKLLELLGSGGSGTVFKARQLDADRLIALKVLHPRQSIDDEFRERFFREAQALNKLSHINIVTVYHLGFSADALPYIAMELLSGESLRKILADNGRLSVDRVYKITKQLCSALCSIHEAGIVHRDLKPENILLMQGQEDDLVKIIDFGLVKMPSTSDQKLTKTGLLLGSINYMSPEQCQGKKADARSDIYSLAVCMYEMLAGEPPFTADNPIGLMYKHVNLPPPELKLATGKSVHPAIQQFISNGLEKDPSLRFQSASEIDASLSKLAEYFDAGVPEGTSFSANIAQWLPSMAFVSLFILISSALAVFIYKHPVKTKAAPRSESAEQHRLDERYKHLLTKTHSNMNAAKLAVDFNDLAKEYVLQGDYTSAESILKRALAINEKTFEPANEAIANNLTCLASVYCQQQHFAEAEPLLVRALAIREKATGPNNEQHLAESLNILAEIYEEEENLKKPEERQLAKIESLLKRAVLVVEKAYGTDDPVITQSLNQLAGFYSYCGRPREAELLYKRSLQITEKALGPTDVGVAASLSALGRLYENECNFAKAESLYKRSAEIMETQRGPNDLEFAHNLGSLAHCKVLEGNYAEAETLYKQSLAIRDKVLGPNANNRDLADDCFWLADCNFKQKKYADAEGLYRRALSIQEKTLGAGQVVAETMSWLGSTYRERGNLAEAESLYKRSIKIGENAPTSNKQTLAQTLSWLADIYFQDRKYADAEALYQRAFVIRKNELEPNHPAVAEALKNLQKCREHTGKQLPEGAMLQKRID